MNLMKWYGLTGGIASGKSTVSGLFREAGIPVIDADVMARLVIAPGTAGLQSIIREFGSGLLASDQSLDRKKMADLIFSDPIKRDQLEKIIHPLIKVQVSEERRRLSESGVKLAIYDVPLLFEKNMQTHFDKVILVWCDSATQRQRLKLRNHLSELEINNRLAAQMSLDEKRKTSDFVIDNNLNLENLRQEFLRVLALL